MVESRLTVSSVALEDSGVYKCASDAASRGAKVAVVVTSGEFFFECSFFISGSRFKVVTSLQIGGKV